MEDWWKRAKSFAEEAAKKSQTLTIPNSAKFVDFVSETAKKSKEFATEASKKADRIKDAALKQADQIKLSEIIPPQLSSSLSISNYASPSSILSSSSSSSPIAASYSPAELEKFGISEDLRHFVKGLTSSTFKNFPLKKDEAEASDVLTTASNVRKDLNEWQEKHATLVLSTVKEISTLRYELCPRIMKERNFWKIYYTLVSSHVDPYERKYMEEVQLKEAAEQKENSEANQLKGTDMVEGRDKNTKSTAPRSSSTEQDIDTFLLGDLDDSDGSPDDGDINFDEDFDKIGNSDVDEDDKHAKKVTSSTD